MAHRAGILFYLIMVTISLVLFPIPGPAEKPDEEVGAVVEVVKDFFRVIETSDLSLAKKIMLPGSSYHSTRQNQGKQVVKTSTYDEVLKSFTAAQTRYREEMFDPEVKVHKDIAILWARYKFYRDGKFSHCGVDSFSLIKVEGKWKIAAVVYTVEATGCDQNWNRK
jgi:hypothetical protein